MKKTIIGIAISTVLLIFNSTVFAAARPKPFGLVVGSSTYEECIKILKERNWNYQEYDVVKKNLMGEDFTDNYTYVLWKKDNIYLELQKLSAHFVRLLYVEKVLYENYKDFLFKPYESFRRQEIKPDWMKDL